jgi:hypothetical protein
MSVVMNDLDDPKKPEAEKPNVEGAEATDEAFISEDDLNTFEGWLKYQGIGAATATSEELAILQDHYDGVRKRDTASSKVGLMKLPPLVPDEHRYAVAVRDGSGLWLTLWVRRSPKGEFFIMVPRKDRGWDPHTSYHRDGTLHMKSFGSKVLTQKRQPLTDTFRGTEPLGVHKGHGPKGVGAICDPAAFSGVLEVEPSVLGPRDGGVLVDLVEPGCEPIPQYSFARIVREGTYQDTIPWVVIRVGTGTPSPVQAQ